MKTLILISSNSSKTKTYLKVINTDLEMKYEKKLQYFYNFYNSYFLVFLWLPSSRSALAWPIPPEANKQPTHLVCIW